MQFDKLADRSAYKCRKNCKYIPICKKRKNQQTDGGKIYFLDTGLRNARLNFAFPDEGQMLENIVYNELIYNGYSVNIGTFDTVTKDKNGKSVRKTSEVDFFAKRGTNQFYIQVCASLADTTTRAREVRPFLQLNDQVRKIIVTGQNVNENLDENGFVIIGAIDFLLRFIK